MNKKCNSKTVVILLILLAVIGVASYISFLTNPNTKSNTSNQKPISLFSFTGAQNWRQGPTNKTSMALFSKERSDGTSACFTSAELRSGDVDTNTETDKLQKSLSSTGGQATSLANTPSTLRTTEGDMPYELHQYRIDGGSSNKDTMQGLALGYVNLSEGHVKIEVHCEMIEDLTYAATATQAYKLNK